MEYQIVVEEIWRKTVEVEALHYGDALDKVLEAYNAGNITVSYDNWNRTNFYEYEEE